jgi:signal peptidase I
MQNDSQPEKPNYPWNETIRTVLVALLLAMTFRSLAYEPFHIPSGSMKSNLLIGDYLFVSKYSYGYSRYSSIFSTDG